MKIITKMQNRIDVRKILTYLSLTVIMAFVYNISLKEHVFASDIYIAITLLGCLGVLMLAHGKKIWQKIKMLSIKEGVLFGVCLLLLLIMLIGNGDLAHGNFGKPFFSVYTVLLLLVYVYVEDCNKPLMQLITVFTLEHVFFTWFFYFCPNLYKNHIIPLFPEFEYELIWQFEHNQAAGFTMHYSTNGIYLAVGVIAFVCLLLSEKGKKKIPYAVLSAVTMATLFLTGKRGHLLFVVAALFLVYFILNIKKIKKVLITSGIVLAAGVVLVLLVSLFIPDILTPFTRFFTEADITNGRMPLYRLALDEFLEHPIFGNGWGSYKYAFDASGVAGTRNNMDTHNVYLQLLSESGIVGFGVFVSIFIYMLATNIRLLHSDKREISPYLIFALGIQLFFLMYCVTGNPLYDVQISFIYVFACSVVLMESRKCWMGGAKLWKSKA